MRNYKFRGKRLDNNQWVYGFYWTNDFDNHFIRVIIENEEFVIKDYEVIPETVGQFTGLKDKNGKDIYDGDFVEYLYDKYWSAYLCKWNEHRCEFA